MSKTITVKPEDEEIRLDRWFKRHLPEMPHALLQKQLRKGQVRINGKKAKTSYRVKVGDEILIPTIEPSTRKERIKETPRLDEKTKREIQQWVLFKDEHVLAINKPAGLAVQGGSKQVMHLDAVLDELKFDAASRPKLVHRLDKDTSGVMLLARTTKAAESLSKAFASKAAQKTYWALCVNNPEIDQGKIDMRLAKAAKGKDSRMEKVHPDSKGQKAITYYRAIEKIGKKACWVELIPETGRTHQLRVHMSEIGCPIVGDGKYGGREAFLRGIELPKQLHLHARHIMIDDVLGSKIEVTAPLPTHMLESFSTLGLEEGDADH